MTLSLCSTLSLFVLITLSTVIFFVSRRFKLPYTVLLVVVGLLLVPLGNLPYLEGVIGFLSDMALTPELLLYIFLPVIIFDASFNMNIRKMLEASWSITLLTCVGVLVSTIGVAVLLYYCLPLVGFQIPFVIALLFSSLISSIDPSALMPLFRRVGVPRRLRIMFDGESLFSDDTTVALFLVIMDIARSGLSDASTFLVGGIMFISMVVFGVLFGLLAAALFSRGLRLTRSNEFATVTLFMISAHLVFVLAEVINGLGVIRISPIIATAVSALFLGNYSRNILAPKVDTYLGKLIGHLSFIVNSLVFLMSGLLFANSGIDINALWLPILITVVIVAFVRVVAVHASLLPVIIAKLEAPIPRSWLTLLSWASLRGVLVIIFILLILPDFTVEGWSLHYSPRDFILALAIGCILATLFIKVPLTRRLIHKLKLDEPQPLNLAHEADLGMYCLLTEQARLYAHHTRGFVDSEQFSRLVVHIESAISDTKREREDLALKYGAALFDQSLHLSMVHVEQMMLKRLYQNNEVSERTFRRVQSKLNLQIEKIEYAQHDDIDPEVYTDRRDIFDRLVGVVQTLFERLTPQKVLEEQLQYYRAQMIMARKAVQEIEEMQLRFDEQPVFLVSSYETVLERYRRYREQSALKMDQLVHDHSSELAPYLGMLASKSLSSSGAKALAQLYDKGLVTDSAEASLRRRYAAW